MDIKPPKPRATPAQCEEVPQTTLPKVVQVPVEAPEGNDRHPTQRSWWRNWKLLLPSGIVLALLAMGIGWFAWVVTPVEKESQQNIRFVVEKGASTAAIANSLEDHGLVKSSTGFRVYTELTRTKSRLQAGVFSLSPSQSVSEIVSRLIGGSVSEVSVIVLPGLTLKQQMDPEIPNSLAWQGYSSAELEQAFAASYDSPVLADKPSGTSLEGYLYPETYRVNASDPASVLVQKTLDEFSDTIASAGLQERYKAQGLTLYQGITLASIISEEVNNPDDQRQVAQVFLKRLREDIVLGSDVTFIYAAEQLGVTPTVGLDSPYNTRKYPGLPPGPIANMGQSALEAVANPAGGDYLYFVAGDGADAGKTYFARTEAEHQANINAHCRELCR